MITKQQQSNDRGFASIVIALTLVMILALLTVGFAQLTRREQRNALNKQLATQAYYAAETGINDAIFDIKAANIVASNTDCRPVQTTAPGHTMRTHPETPVNSSLDVSYSCISIDLDPSKVQYSNFGDSAYHTVTFKSASTLAVKTLTISWTSTGGRTAGATVGSLKPQYVSTNPATWQYPALMEISLTPLDNLSRTALSNKNLTIYAYPVTGASGAPSYDLTGGVTAANSPTEGGVYPAHCGRATPTDPYICSLTISAIDNSGAGAGPYMLHLTDHYDESDVTVTGTDINNVALKFSGAQAVIDSTGRARGVLKRLQVHVPLVDSAVLPNYAIEATNVCKRMSVMPGTDATFTAADGTACGY